MAERSFRPFPQIPRYPGEVAKRGKVASQAFPEVAPEPPLEGAESAEDSIFTQPGLENAIGLAHDFAGLTSKARAQFVHREVQQFGVDPQRGIELLDNLAYLAEAAEKPYPGASQFAAALQKELHSPHLEEVPSDEAFGEWLEMEVNDKLYGELARDFLTGVIAKGTNPHAASERMYNAALGGFRSQNPKVVERTIEILSGVTPMFPADSRPYFELLVSNAYPDPVVLGRAYEIDSARHFMTQQYRPDLQEASEKNLQAVIHSTEFMDRGVALARNHPEQMNDILRFQSAPHIKEGAGVYALNPEQQNGLPQWIIDLYVKTPGELQLLTNQQIQHLLEKKVSEKKSVVRHVALPGHRATDGFGSEQEYKNFIQSRLHTLNEGHAPIDAKAYWETVSHLVPDGVTQDQLLDMMILNEEMSASLRDNAQYSLSPRGDLVEVADDQVRSLGIQSVLFEMDPRNKRDTLVTVHIGNFDYRAVLDEQCALREVSSGERMHLPDESAFIQQVILSHLHEVRCSDKVNETGNEGSHDAARKAFTSRRAHRRILPPGQKPTTHQIGVALQDYGIDIVRRNRERVARGEAQLITYVGEVDAVAVAGLGPVRSRTPEATEALQHILQTTAEKEE